MLRVGTIGGDAARMPNSWLAVVRYTLLLFCCMQACAQLLLSESNRWREWSEDNRNGSWRVYNLSSLPSHLNYSSFNGGEVVLLNTSCCVDGSGSSGNQESFSLIGPLFMTTDSCTIDISYLLLTSEPVEVLVRLNDGTNQLISSLTNMSNSAQLTLPSNVSNTSAQLVLNVMVPDNSDVMLLIGDVSECVNISIVDPSLSTTPTMSTISFMTSTSSPVITGSSIETSTNIASMFSTRSTSQPIVSNTTSISDITTSSTLTTTAAIITTTTSFTIATSFAPTTATSSTFSISVASSPISSLITTTDAGVTATSVIDITSLVMNATSFAVTPSMSSTIVPVVTTFISVTSTMITGSPMLTPSSPVMTSTPVNSTALGNDREDGTSFFSTTIIIAIAGGGSVLLLILLLLLCCCVCYRVRVSRRNHQKYYISNASNFDHHHKPGHSSHSSVFAQDRYRHKSRSTESVSSSPYMYELPHVHVETGPTSYRHSTGDEDTIDSDNEDIRHDLKGTPISSRRTSEHRMVNFHPHSNGRPYGTHAFTDSYSDDNQYSDDNLSKTSEVSDVTVYPNRNLLSEMCGGELPPILSLGDHEDDDDIVITNPYYVEPKNDEVSPRRSRKRSIDLEALTTLESSGEHDYQPKQPVYNKRSGAPPSSSKNHKLLRKTKSELNLEDATKIVKDTRHHHSHKQQSKSRIDLREATKLGQSDLAKVSYQHRSLARQPHYSSSPKILDTRESSSKLERLTSLT